MAAFRVTTVFTGTTGIPWVSTMWIDTATAVNAQAASDAVRAFWLEFIGIIDSGITAQQELEVPEYTTPDTVAGVNTVSSAPVIFIGDGDKLPPATQALVRWRTSEFNGNRRVQGRTFIPGLIRFVSDANGRPTADLLGVMNTAAATLVTDGLVIASRALNQFVGAIGGDAWTEFAVLRSRRD